VDTNILKVLDFSFIKVEVSRFRCGQVLYKGDVVSGLSEQKGRGSKTLARLEGMVSGTF
jgi:hypothetical protein